MNAEILLRHLYDLGATVGLMPDARALDIEAPKSVLTPELIELLREHKAELVQMVFEEAEREALQWEGASVIPQGVKLTGDARMIEAYRHHPLVVRFIEAGTKYFAATEAEFMKAA